MRYRGRCHCGAVRFVLDSEQITEGRRCNCSMCRRKGAVMSARYYAPGEIKIAGLDSLETYQFGDHEVNHYFCRTCGIYPFHDVTGAPGQYRINLGCVEDLDVLGLAISVLDGAAL